MVAGGAVAAATVSSILKGGFNPSSLWTMMNQYQLLVFIGLLDLKFPAKTEAFLKGFRLASLNIPKEYHYFGKLFANNSLNFDTNERFAKYNFRFSRFILQQVPFIGILTLTIFVYVMFLITIRCCKRDEDERDAATGKANRISTKVCARVMNQFYVPALLSIYLNFKFLVLESPIDYISFVLAICFGLLLVCYPIYFLVTLARKEEQIHDE